MAKRKKTSKFHHYVQLAFIFLGGTVLVAALIFGLSLTGFFGTTGETVVYTNDMYVLKGSPTAYQKQIFKELSAEVDQKNQDDKAIVALVVKNFIADYYTWSNKMGSYDVGGKEYIYYKEYTNFNQTSRRYFTIAMSNYIAKGLSLKDLNTVNDVTITFCDHSNGYQYYDERLDSYYVTATWTYVENDKLDTSVFPSSAEFTVIVNEEGRYEIAQFY